MIILIWVSKTNETSNVRFIKLFCPKLVILRVVILSLEIKVRSEWLAVVKDNVLKYKVEKVIWPVINKNYQKSYTWQKIENVENGLSFKTKIEELLTGLTQTQPWMEKGK